MFTSIIPHRALEEYGWRDAARLRGDEQGTFMGWDQQASERIDYCWLSAALEQKLTGYTVLRETSGSHQP